MMSFKKVQLLTLFVIFILFQLGCQRSEYAEYSYIADNHSSELQDDFESEQGYFSTLARCKQATADQIGYVNLGTSKLNQFLQRCYRETNSKKWCDQVARPNPDSRSTFDCTYSPQQPHVFVHPEENTWAHAIGAVKLVIGLEQQSIKVETIYNWWRPEPYNANVGGAAGRHPQGTSVDVRFSSKTEQNKAHKALCAARKKGLLRALGYYSGTGLHLGVGDKTPNTWGKSCS